MPPNVVAIALSKAIRATDPNFLDNIETDTSPPAPAQQTGGPNRLTLYVPYDDTTLSLGEASRDRIKDVGITGRTDNHIHWHVTQGTPTVVSLGEPATSVAAP